MTVQKICGLFGSLIFEIWHLNHVLDVNKCREWVVDRSQNMGPNCLEFLVIFLTSVTVQRVGCCLCGDLVLKCLLGMLWAGNGRGLRVH